MNTIKNFLVHWKTSLCGIVAGAITAFGSGQSVPHIVTGAAIAVLGLVASDGDKSLTGAAK